jgi:hypothetical protein
VWKHKKFIRCFLENLLDCIVSKCTNTTWHDWCQFQVGIPNKILSERKNVANLLYLDTDKTYLVISMFVCTCMMHAYVKGMCFFPLQVGRNAAHVVVRTLCVRHALQNESVFYQGWNVCSTACLKHEHSQVISERCKCFLLLTICTSALLWTYLFVTEVNLSETRTGSCCMQEIPQV